MAETEHEKPSQARRRKAGQRKKPAKRPAAPASGERAIAAVAGIPDEAQLHEALRALSTRDQEIIKRLRQLLAEHLGSDAAARLWLVSPAAGFVSTPLEAIRQGQAEQVLALLESQGGPSPSYA